MSITHFCVLVHHRLPALCCAFLCSGALALTVGSISTCQFLKINYVSRSGSLSPLSFFGDADIIIDNNFDNIGDDYVSGSTDIYMNTAHYNSYRDFDVTTTTSSSGSTSIARARSSRSTHDLGLFCASSNYIDSSNKDIMWQLARGFTFASLFLVSFGTIISWTCTFCKPSYNSWKILSIITIVAAGVETPIFLFYASQPCSTDGQECLAGLGFFMLLWSIISLVSVTIVTQVFNYPEYIDVLDEWKVMKDNRSMKDRNFLNLIESVRDLEQQQQFETGGGGGGCATDAMDYNNFRVNHHRIGSHHRQLVRNINNEGDVQEYLINHNHIIDSNANLEDDEGERRMKRSTSMNLFARSLAATKSMLLKNTYVKHEIFEEDSDNENDNSNHNIHINLGNNNNFNNNNKNINCANLEKMELGCSQSQYSKEEREEGAMKNIKYLDTKSDSSRLLIRIGEYGNRNKEDDRASIKSFEVNLNDYGILSDDDEDVDSNNGGEYSYIQSSYDQECTPPRSQHDKLSQGEGSMESYESNDGEIIVYPVQFSPSSRAASQSESPDNKDLHVRHKAVFPTQQLTRYNSSDYDGDDDDDDDDDDNEAEVDSKNNEVAQEIVTSSTVQRALVNAVLGETEVVSETKQSSSSPVQEVSSSRIMKRALIHAVLGNEHKLNSLSLQLDKENNDSIKKCSPYSILMQHQYLGKEETDQDSLMFQEDMSTYKAAIVSGTNAAVESNNHQEVEPEPVYYSSDDSDTSSISSYTQSPLLDEGSSVFDGIEDVEGDVQTENQSSYSDSDLIQTSKYLNKKIKRLRRKAEKRKEKSMHRKSPIGSRSVCSKISLTEYTIDEETDLDLELEDYSGDDLMEGQSSCLYNVVTPLNDEYHSVKSSPANMSSGLHKKSRAYFFTDIDNGYHQKKGKSRCLPQIVPIIIPSDNELGHDSEDCSLSSSVRSARRQRIRMEMVKSRIRSPKNQSEILRFNHSMDESYGSDEASC